MGQAGSSMLTDVHELVRCNDTTKNLAMLVSVCCASTEVKVLSTVSDTAGFNELVAGVRELALHSVVKEHSKCCARVVRPLTRV